MSDYNIHIHLPGEQHANVKSNMQEEQPAKNNMGKWFDGLLERVKHCYDWKSIYTLKDDFEKVGLTLHDTAGGRKVLCRIEEGQPVVKNIVDDYIFMGSSSNLDEEISNRALEVILYFLENKASEPKIVMDSSQSYSKDMKLYGEPLKIYAEDANFRSQEVQVLGRLINE